MTIKTSQRMPKSHFSARHEPLEMDTGLPLSHSVVGVDEATPNLAVRSTSGLSSLSNKAVDEVWGEIQQPQHRDDGDKMRSPERNPSLGEMTLENFLVKAGVVTETPTDKKGILPIFGVVDSNVAPQFQYHQGQWVQYQQQQQQPQFQQTQQNVMGVYLPSQPFPHPLSLAPASVMDVPFAEGQMAALQDTSSSVRKRAPTHDDVVEKSAERRHKRMIKNRESAARSRARKQAYTSELEIKISHLEEENERLRKRKNFMEDTFSNAIRESSYCTPGFEEMEDALLSVPMPDQKYQLRRTSSAPL